MADKKTYFSIEKEMCVSGSHPSLTETPPKGGTIWNNLQNLIDKCLDPVREKLAQPVIVTSAYRPPRLNAKVGGAKNSNHLYGYAADIHTGNGSTDNVKIIKTVLKLGIIYDELIAEGAKFNSDGTLKSCEWVHVAVRPNDNDNRMKCLYTIDKKTYHPLKKTIVTDVKVGR